MTSVSGFSTSSCRSFSSGRGVAAAIVVAAHVGLIYGAMQLRSRETPPPEPKPLEVFILAEQSPPPLPSAPTPPPVMSVSMPSIEQPLLDLPNLSAPENAITMAAQKPAPDRGSPSEAASAPKLVSAVEYIRQPQPRYPDVSRRLREQGTVMVMALIDEVGRACQVDVHRSSGYERLDKAAREAVSDAVFKPYLEDGIARPFRVVIPIEFGLHQRLAQR